jgi:hypothetical protein
MKAIAFQSRIVAQRGRAHSHLRNNDEGMFQYTYASSGTLSLHDIGGMGGPLSAPAELPDRGTNRTASSSTKKVQRCPWPTASPLITPISPYVRRCRRDSIRTASEAARVTNRQQAGAEVVEGQQFVEQIRALQIDRHPAKARHVVIHGSSDVRE